MQSSAPARDQELSYFTPYGYQSGSCGYCKDPESSQRTPDSRASYYVKSSHLMVEHYQILMDRGWRRSGSLLYLPDNRRSCCPHYTIRLPSENFKPSRDQRQTLNRWNKFVLGDTYSAIYAKLHPRSKAEKQALRNCFDLVSTVHACETDKLVHTEPKPEHTYSVRLESDAYTEEKYSLFEKYQRIVHKEQPSSISKSGFKRFLCSSPLRQRGLPAVTTAATTNPSLALVEVDSGAAETKPLGSYHQVHRLNGDLIAFSVLDFLDHAVSAVYFIYDPAFEKHGLGKLSALREAAMAEEHGYKYYYMGYYIHNCAKMKYKADFKPQEVLDASLGASELSWKTLDAGIEAQMTAKTFGLPPLAPHFADRLSALQHPIDAAAAGLSLLELGVPGVLPTDMLLPPMFDMDSVLISVGGQASGAQQLIPAGMLALWNDKDDNDDNDRSDGISDSTELEVCRLENSGSLKGTIAELVAAVGLNVASDLVVDFTASV